ncbi:MAG: sulfur carrier protein ThiS [Desulfovibrio sp.]|jgi:thiamine biosynthesis protein ThiS|nr:sulfur carrier protein ThiS [Desulfovibrio sp.]
MEQKTKELVINGESRLCAAHSLSDLLKELGLGESAVVAEINGKIVSRQDFAVTILAFGDKIELARFVGGG